MYINFGECTEVYESHAIQNAYSSGGYKLCINNYNFYCNDYNKVKTVYNDILNALEARKIIYTVSGSVNEFIEKRYDEIVNARQIAAKQIDKLIRDKVQYNKNK